MPTLEEKVGDALREQRTVAGLTLSELAGRADVSSGMISRIERGQVSASLSTLAALADAMSMPMANLFGGTVESTEVSHVKSGEGVGVVRRGSTYGHSYRLLGKVTIPHMSLDPYLTTIERDSEQKQPLFQQPLFRQQMWLQTKANRPKNPKKRVPHGARFG